MFPIQLSSFTAIPNALLLLIIQSSLVYAQSSLPLVFNQSLSLTTDTLSSPPILTIPGSSSPITISVALCSALPGDGPRFFVTNNSAISDPGLAGGDDVFEIAIGANGIGNFTLESAGGGGVFAFSPGSSTLSFEVGLSDSRVPLHVQLSTLPLLGDTTSNQALLFSPPFLPQPFDDPTYPNYTLPSANTSVPTPPSGAIAPNFTLILGPTSSFPTFDFNTNSNVGGLPVTACALQGRSDLVVGQPGDPGANAVSSLWQRDASGWRTQWLVSGVQPSTNYTAYIVQDGTKVSGPINMVTKSATFSCPLAHSLPYCPATSYAVPLPAPPFPATTYDASNFPNSVADPLLAYMTNFTTTLLTFACGRDWYSPMQTCADCQRAYRTWLCAVSLPRCAEDPTASSPSTQQPSHSGAQVVLPAVQSQSNGTTPRNPFLPAVSGDWVELLPCIETCFDADRACPNFLGFRCPSLSFNAAASYGVGYIDGDDARKGGDWMPGGGMTGKSQDRWGHVWCNG